MVLMITMELYWF